MSLLINEAGLRPCLFVRYALVVLLLFGVSQSLAVGEPLFFRSINKEQGLSQVSVIDMIKSRSGYLWIATQDGLNRYDGYSFKTYKHDPSDPTSISDNFVWSIVEDNQGYLWVGTAKGGLNRFDPRTERFQRFQFQADDATSLSNNQVLDLFIDQQQQLWIATAGGGVNLFNAKDQTFTRFLNTAEKPNLLNGNTVKVIADAGDGQLWLGYSHAPFLVSPGKGFSRFDPNTQRNQDFNSQATLADPNVTDIFMLDDENVFISTYGGGVVVLDSATEAISQLPLPEPLSKARVMNLSFDSQRTLWMAIMGGGLVEYDIATRRAFLHRANEAESLSLNHNSLSHVKVDDNLLWAGTWQEGLNVSNINGRRFPKILGGFNQPNGLGDSNVTFLHQAADTQDIWLTNSESLIQYDRNLNVIQRYPTNELINQDEARTIQFVFTDSSGRIWFNCEQLGLFRSELNPQGLLVDQPLRFFSAVTAERRIIAMAEVDPQTFIVGTRGEGLIVLDLNNLQAYPAAKEAGAFAVTKNGIVRDPYLSGFWIATMDQGIKFYNDQLQLSPLTELNQLLQEVTITSVLTINKNELWLATQGGGVYRLLWSGIRDLNSAPTITSISEKDGLSSNAIGAIVSIDNNILITTTQGMSVLNLDTKEIRNYDIYDGVLPGYSIGVYTKVGNEGVLFGSFDGATLVRPRYLYEVTKPQKLIIDTLLLGNKEAVISNDERVSPLDTVKVAYASKLNFHHSLSHFTLGFNNLNYINPSAIEYAYRLRGFDDEWLYTDASRRYATYTNLDSGDYWFELKSTDHLGRWQENIVSLPISVQAPPWKTWWAYLLYTLAVLLIATTLLWQRLKQIAAIKERNEQLTVTSKLFENTSEGVLLFDRNHKIALINDGFANITGYQADEVMGQKFILPVAFEQQEDLFDEILSQVDDGSKWQGELWAQRKTGDVFPIEIVIDKISSNNNSASPMGAEHVYHFVAILSDITQRKKDEQKLTELAYYDELTLLPNRSNFENQVEQHIEQCSAAELKPFAVMFVDLDNFKAINDSLGHNIGDQFLKKLAERLRQEVDHRVRIARLGGDEFLVMVPNDVIAEQTVSYGRTAQEVAEATAHDIYEACMFTIDVNEYKLRATCSIGVAIFPQHGLTFERLLRNADTAMYEAKRDRVRKIRCYNQQMNILAREQFEVAEEIRNDIKAQSFVPFYQLKTDTKTGDAFGVEVLTRWRNHKLGNISPAKFIPIAEERGLINALSEFILETACRQIGPLIASGRLQGRMAVNLSPVQFQQVDTVERIESILRKTDFDPSWLEIEVTESIAIFDRNQAQEQLQRIRDLGVTIALDDFGTGFSSLSYLHKFPLDTVKIDRSFIHNLMGGEENRKIVSAIIQMSHSLGLSVIAEGVETEQELNFLKLNHCDYLQGFYFHKPCDFAALEQCLEQFSNS